MYMCRPEPVVRLVTVPLIVEETAQNTGELNKGVGAIANRCSLLRRCSSNRSAVRSRFSSWSRQTRWNIAPGGSGFFREGRHRLPVLGVGRRRARDAREIGLETARSAYPISDQNAVALPSETAKKKDRRSRPSRPERSEIGLLGLTRML